MAVITVEYAASTPLADKTSLEKTVEQAIQRHIRSIKEVPNKDVQLHVKINRFNVNSEWGNVGLHVRGNVNQTTIDRNFDAKDKRRRKRSDDVSERLVKLWIGNLSVFLFRLVFPSSMTRAIGHRVISVRVERALEDCLADVRIMIDECLGRPETNGERSWAAAKRQAIIFAFIAFAATCIAFWIRQTRLGDPVRGGFSCILITMSVYAFTLGQALLRLPNRFYQAEREGRKLVALVGVKSPAAIRSVGLGIVIVSLAIIAAGVYCLFLERY